MDNNFFITVLYGIDQTSKLLRNDDLSENDFTEFIKTYYFKTMEEKAAFIFGLNEANGWLDLVFFENVRNVGILDIKELYKEQFYIVK